MLSDITATVVEQKAVGKQLYWLKVMPTHPEKAPAYLPGQFSMVSVADDDVFWLRRPFTPLTVEADGALTYFYKVLGEGTQRMSRWQPGQPLRVLGPLGKPFPLEAPARNTLLMAGGVGIAPMVYLAHWWKAQGKAAPRLIYGARGAVELFGTDLLEAAGVNALLTTDDGSRGLKGNVCDALEQEKTWLQEACESVILCGPNPMMAAVVRKLQREVPGLPVYVSLENHMPCGTGACYGCVVAQKEGPPMRICVEGPTVPAERLVWTPTGPSVDAWGHQAAPCPDPLTGGEASQCPV